LNIALLRTCCGHRAEDAFYVRAALVTFRDVRPGADADTSLAQALIDQLHRLTHGQGDSRIS